MRKKTKMTPQEIVTAIKQNNEDDHDVIDAECFRRLTKRADDFGNEGVISLKLLSIVKELLEL